MLQQQHLQRRRLRPPTACLNQQAACRPRPALPCPALPCLQVEKELQTYGDMVFVREKTNYQSILHKTFYVSCGSLQL